MCKHTHLQPRARTSGLERLQNKVRNSSQGTEGPGLGEGAGGACTGATLCCPVVTPANQRICKGKCLSFLFLAKGQIKQSKFLFAFPRASEEKDFIKPEIFLP